MLKSCSLFCWLVWCCDDPMILQWFDDRENCWDDDCCYAFVGVAKNSFLQHAPSIYFQFVFMALFSSSWLPSESRQAKLEGYWERERPLAKHFMSSPLFSFDNSFCVAPHRPHHINKATKRASYTSIPFIQFRSLIHLFTTSMVPRKIRQMNGNKLLYQ